MNPSNQENKSHWKTRKFVVDKNKIDKFRRRVDLIGNRPPPMLFRRFELFTYISMAAGAAYVILFHDFGDGPHIYSKARELFNIKKSEFWTLSDKERKELEERGSIVNKQSKN
ncbi:hypothetical protein BB559_001728 [Furculomyces boomerangus]|uniref:Uncharacterized protein n=1 Tax=Furculomyces boomerangus TaxID=61424 RepID=A0A2T9Z0W6_9FUNG|nr:hypothetical protein BB559_001728 [Furculomyces boomerangus]